FAFLDLRQRQQRWDEALEALERAREIGSCLLNGSRSDDTEWKDALVSSTIARAQVYKAQGRDDEADQAYQSVQRLARSLYELDPESELSGVRLARVLNDSLAWRRPAPETVIGRLAEAFAVLEHVQHARPEGGKTPELVGMVGENRFRL